MFYYNCYIPVTLLNSGNNILKEKQDDDIIRKYVLKENSVSLIHRKHFSLTISTGKVEVALLSMIDYFSKCSTLVMSNYILNELVHKEGTTAYSGVTIMGISQIILWSQ